MVYDYTVLFLQLEKNRATSGLSEPRGVQTWKRRLPKEEDTEFPANWSTDLKNGCIFGP